MSRERLEELRAKKRLFELRAKRRKRLFELRAKRDAAQSVQTPAQPVQQQPIAQESQGLLTRTAEDLRQRGAQLANIAEFERTGQQTGLESGLQRLGTQAGAVGDITGQALVSGASTAFEALPEVEQEALKLAGKDLLESEVGQLAKSAFEAGGEAWDAFKKENPRAARNIEAVANIATVGLVGAKGAPAAVAGSKLAGRGGKVAGRGLQAAGGAVGAGTAKALAPKIAEDVADLAKRAKDFDIPLRLDQISDSRVRRTVQKVGQEIPLSGDAGFEKVQRTAFNAATAKTIGQSDLTPDSIKKFRKDINTTYSDVLKGRKISVADDVKDRLVAIKDEARSTIETGLADVVDKNADKVLAQISDGAIDTGEKLASMHSETLKRAVRAQGGSSEFVGDVVDVLDDIAAKNLPAAKAKELGKARRKWRNFKTLQPLLEKSTTGEINPTELINRVAASKFITASGKKAGDDDLVDLARIGKEFLPKLGGSDTAQKLAVRDVAQTGIGKIIGGGAVGAGVGAGAGATLGGIGTAALAGGVVGANRAIQAVNRSQRLVDASIKASKKRAAKKSSKKRRNQ